MFAALEIDELKQLRGQVQAYLDAQGAAALQEGGLQGTLKLHALAAVSTAVELFFPETVLDVTPGKVFTAAGKVLSKVAGKADEIADIGKATNRATEAQAAGKAVANSTSSLATRERVLANIADSQAARGASRFDIQSGFEIALFGDVSTARNGAVFFSGRTPGGLANADLAGSFANQTAKDILNFTPAGRQLGELNLYPRLALDSNGVVVPRYAAETSRVFEIASQRYAEAASGRVFAFTNGALPNSIFTRIELPALRANPNVTDIRFLNSP